MGYDDGFYYGQSVLVCLADKASDNGKTVTVSNGVIQWTGVINNMVCRFSIPGKDRYSVSIDGFTTNVELSYGECKAVHLSNLYELGTQGQLNEIKSKNNDSSDKIGVISGSLSTTSTKVGTSESNISSIKNSINCDGKKFKLYCGENGEYGYTKKDGGDKCFCKFFNTAAFIGFEFINNNIYMTRTMIPDNAMFSVDDYDNVVLHKPLKNYVMADTYLQKNSVDYMMYTMALKAGTSSAESQGQADHTLRNRSIIYDSSWDNLQNVSVEFKPKQGVTYTGDGEVVVAIMYTGTDYN